VLVAVSLTQLTVELRQMMCKNAESSSGSVEEFAALRSNFDDSAA